MQVWSYEFVAIGIELWTSECLFQLDMGISQGHCKILIRKVNCEFDREIVQENRKIYQ